MQTNRVIETFEVRKDGRAGLPVRLERHAVHTLTRECVKEGLHGRIVVTVGRAAHADFEAHLGQKGLIAPAGGRAAPIGVMEHVRLGVPTSQGHLEGQGDQVLILSGSHRPSHHHAGEQVQDHCQVQPPLSRRESGESGDPLAVRTIGRTIPCQQVGGEVRRGITAGGDWLASLVRLGTQAQRSHQAHHPLASTTPAPIPQGHVQARTPIRLAILQEQALNFGRTLGIFSAFAGSPGVCTRHSSHSRTPQGPGTNAPPDTPPDGLPQPDTSGQRVRKDADCFF